MAKIKTCFAKEILDSRGNPTIETTVVLEDGGTGISSIPSGASVSKYEAVELRDNDPQRFGGMGVLKAVATVNETIAPKIIAMAPEDQKLLDQTLLALDGTANKANLGANSILSVSQAVCKAEANSKRRPLFQHIQSLAQTESLPSAIEKMPTPTFNVINGGLHGASNLDFQEFMVIPPTSKTYREGLELGVALYNALKRILIYRNATYAIGDEGGFAPNLYRNLDALEMIREAVSELKLRLGYDVFFGLDCAASQFRKGTDYQLKDRPTAFTTDELLQYYENLANEYKLLLIEDPFSEDDLAGWAKLTATLGPSLMVIGDDLIATNPSRLSVAIENKLVTGTLIKPNQIGTVSETLSLVKKARKAGFTIVVSHRSGETNDTFIADFAVGVRAHYVKFGAPARGERVAKYNRLLEIEKEIETLWRT